MFPRWMAASFGNQHLLELTPGTRLGCWATTEPGHGSDQLDPSRQIFQPAGEYGRPDCVAALSADQVVINGRKADWISNGTIAEVCILYCAADTGRGPDPERGCVVIIPMDTPGVSRGAPLDKLGQRALNQGAVIFEDVVPRRSTSCASRNGNLTCGSLRHTPRRAAGQSAWPNWPARTSSTGRAARSRERTTHGRGSCAPWIRASNSAIRRSGTRCRWTSPSPRPRTGPPRC